MRFIIYSFFLIHLSYGFCANNDNINDFKNITFKCPSSKKIEYSYGRLNITECRSNTTIQNNKFKIINNNINVLYIINNTSKIFVNNKYVNFKNNSASDYLTKKTKKCNSDERIKYKDNIIYLFSRIPNNNGYCYTMDGYIDKLKINKLYDELDIKVFAKISNNKVFLFKKNGYYKKTKMYLIKGDLIQIVERDNLWLKIIYKGKRNIISWIPLSSIGNIDVN